MAESTSDVRELLAAEYRLFVNEERTVMVRLWPSGVAEVARREHPSHTWEPPTVLKEERVY